MSIIYDALKRIEKKAKDTEYSSENAKRDTRKSRRIGYILLILLVLCLVALFVDKSSTKRYFVERSPTDKHPMFPKVSRIAMTGEEKTPAKVMPLSEPESKPPSADKKLPLFYLSGIFFSDGEYLALINDQLVQADDFIEGAQVQKIDSDGVEIKFGESSFRLSYP